MSISFRGLVKVVLISCFRRGGCKTAKFILTYSTHRQRGSYLCGNFLRTQRSWMLHSKWFSAWHKVNSHTLPHVRPFGLAATLIIPPPPPTKYVQKEVMYAICPACFPEDHWPWDREGEIILFESNLSFCHQVRGNFTEDEKDMTKSLCRGRNWMWHRLWLWRTCAVVIFRRVESSQGGYICICSHLTHFSKRPVKMRRSHTYIHV